MLGKQPYINITKIYELTNLIMVMKISQDQVHHTYGARNSTVYLRLESNCKPDKRTYTTVGVWVMFKPLQLKTTGKLKVTENMQTEDEVIFLDRTI